MDEQQKTTAISSLSMKLLLLACRGLMTIPGASRKNRALLTEHIKQFGSAEVWESVRQMAERKEAARNVDEVPLPGKRRRLGGNAELQQTVDDFGTARISYHLPHVNWSEYTHRKIYPDTQRGGDQKLSLCVLQKDVWRKFQILRMRMLRKIILSLPR